MCTYSHTDPHINKQSKLKNKFFLQEEYSGWQDGSADKGTCHQALNGILGPTWWMERTYSYKLSSDFHMHPVVCMCNFNKFSWHSEGKNRNLS